MRESQVFLHPTTASLSYFAQALGTQWECAGVKILSLVEVWANITPRR
jgi:hypothetical protein